MSEPLEGIRCFHHPCATAAELRAYAELPTLHKSQVVWLLQGFSFRGRASNGSWTVLEEYVPAVEALNAAQLRGEVTFPITPIRLLVQCEQLAIRLPEPFTEQLRSLLERTASGRRFIAQSGAFSRIRPTEEWVRVPSRRGRPKKTRPAQVQGREAEVFALARSMFDSMIRSTGAVPKKKELDAALARKTGRTMSDVARRYAIRALLTQDEIAAARRAGRRRRRETSDI